MRILKNKAVSSRLLVRVARGIVVELLSQGQTTGLCARIYFPFLATF